MIKAFHDITISDVILLDATKSAKSLKKYWFVPLWMIRKVELEDLTKQIFDAIGGDTVQDISYDFDKLSAYRKLQIYEALHKALLIEISLKNRINAWKLILNKTFSESKNLEDVIAKVKEYTGIEINNPRDLRTFEDYIQHRADKYKEMFPEKEIEGKTEVSLTKVLYSVFNFLGEPFKEDTRLITFVEMKQMAEDKIIKTTKRWPIRMK